MNRVIKFYAEWCGPCRVYASTFTKVAEKFEGQIETVSINVDEDPEGLAAKYEVRSIPATVLQKQDGTVVKKVGNLPEDQLTELFLS